MSPYLERPRRTIDDACRDTGRDPAEYMTAVAIERIVDRLTERGKPWDEIEHELRIPQ